MQASQVRLYALLAREAPFAVVFRRGPSKSVLLIGWNTSNDTFQLGQWLKGRIYERRCDLSPTGSLLVYFSTAASFCLLRMRRAAGWQSHGRIAYSPKIQYAKELPREDWDEWYIFENPPDLAENIFEVRKSRDM